ncbi:MAG: methionine--tRNA ligase, partial [Candidatus Omnitrophota bacterium]
VKSKLRDSVDGLAADLEPIMKKIVFSEALERIWVTINLANKSVEEAAPWKLFKENKTNELKTVIVSLLEVLRAAAIAVSPFLPQTAQRIWLQLGLARPMAPGDLKPVLWGYFECGGRIAKGEPLFPRIETEK